MGKENFEEIQRLGLTYNKLLKNTNRQREKLEKQKNNLNTIINTTKDGIAITDLQTNFIFFNDSCIDMTGYAREQLLRMDCLSLVAPSSFARFKEAIKEVLERGFVKNLEVDCLVKDDKLLKTNISIALMPNQNQLLIAAKDVTLLKEKERLLQEYLKQIDQNLITSSTDLEGNIIYASEAFCKKSGYTKEELVGQNHRIIKDPELDSAVYDELWKSISDDKVWTGEIRNRRKDGSTYWVKASVFPTYNESGKKVGYTSIRHDISDKKMIEKLSITDSTTGLFNRRHFNDIFPKIISAAKREKKLVSFIIIDIDYFKQYNDTYGHQKGDEALIQVAKTLKDFLKRANDHCFRLGGEEFGVVFDVDAQKKAFVFANSMREKVEELEIEHEKNSASDFLTVSMGVVCKEAREIESIDDIFRQADELLYRAKDRGRNRVCINPE